ncbi:MAG: hypothetical protein ABI593_08790 [Betaproteobacteria bacterium]
MKKSTIAILTAASLLAAPAFAQDLISQNFIKGGDETLTLNLGGIVNQFDTTLQLNGPGVNGSNLNLEGNGLSKNLSSFEASATWRFLSRNRIDVLFFEAKRSGSRTLDRAITIDGTVIPVNFALGVDAKDAFLLADYRFSFVKTPEVEVAGALGFYGGQFKYNLNATGIRDGQTVEIGKTASTTVPLPLIGVTLDWYINPRWKLSGNVAGIKANIGDVDGSVVVAGAATEFMLTRNVGLGLAYMYSDLDVDVTKGGFDGNLTWKMNSVRAYAQLKF